MTGPRSPHVVMLVANDVATDTRVKKEAITLARAGLRVTIVGTLSENTPRQSWLGPVEIVRVPVEFVIRDDRIRRSRARAMPRLLDPRSAAKVQARISAREQAVIGRSAIAVGRRSPGAVSAATFKIGVAQRTLERQVLRAGWTAARIHGGLTRRLQRFMRHWRASRRVSEAGPVRWRDEHPQVLDYERAFSPVVDGLMPDVIHAHDVHVMGIAAHSRARARQAGRDVPWIYDAHEYVPGLSQYGKRTARVVEGWADLENEFIRDAACVITVSPAIAQALREHYGLASLPAVVLNIPTVDPPSGQPVRTLREVCGLPGDVPLVSYSGVMTPARGVHTAIEAMTQLPDAHLGLVCVPHDDTWWVRKLRQQVDEMGLDRRVHFVNPVGPGQVVDFLRGVDVGLIPGLSYPSHEMSLPNKLFEYLHAGVPVVSSELESLGKFLRETEAGLTFSAGDPDALAAAVRAVLAEHDRYAAAARDPDLLKFYSWSSQAEELCRVYDHLIGAHLAVRASDPTEVDEVMDLTESQRPAS